MVNWQDPTVQILSVRASIFVSYLSAGWYSWEFFVAFPFDWDYITRRRTLRWTLVPYMVARYGVAMSLVAGVVATNAFEPMSANACAAWWRSVYALSHLSVAAASLLLVIRTIAICDRNTWITLFLGAFWLAEVGTLIHDVVMIDAVWVPQLWACATSNTDVSRLNMLTSFVLNFCCLVIVFAYLLRSPARGIWNTLISQGVVYLAVVIVAYLTPSVLLILNLNDGMNLASQPASLMALVICATRMYRALLRINTNTNEDTFIMTATNMDWHRSHRSRVDEHAIVMPPGFVGSSIGDDSQELPRLITPTASRGQFSLEFEKKLQLDIV